MKTKLIALDTTTVDVG
jgi:hypothetical protein